MQSQLRVSLWRNAAARVESVFLTGTLKLFKGKPIDPVEQEPVPAVSLLLTRPSLKQGSHIFYFLAKQLTQQILQANVG